MTLKVGIISDTHNQHDKIVIPDDLDILICCGDVSGRGHLYEIEKFIEQ